MKKCKNCGAIQSDDQTVCLDCSCPLGSSLTEAEERAEEAVFDDKLSDMANRTDDFYIPLRDKIMGIVCILSIVAAILLIIFAGKAQNILKDEIPEKVPLTVGDNFTVMVPGDFYQSPRMSELHHASSCGVLAIVSFIIACPMLLAPRFMWFLSTLKYRVFHEWDTPPSYFALHTRKAATYILFGIGIFAVLYGWLLYF